MAYRESVQAKIIVSDVDLSRIVDRIAHQILEKTDGARDTILLGIPTRGVPLAKRLFEGRPVIAFLKTDCARHILGPQAAPTRPPNLES